MISSFDQCVANGGDVKTLQKGKGKYQRTCTINGKTHEGEVKKKKRRS